MIDSDDLNHYDLEWGYEHEPSRPAQIAVHIEEEPNVETQIRLSSAPKEARKALYERATLPRDFKFGFVFISVALLVIAIGISFMNKQIIQELRQKDLQVNSLIDELGEVREENLMLYQHLLGNEETMGVFEDALTSLEERVEVVDENGGVFGLQNKLNALNEELNSQNDAVDTLFQASLEYSGALAVIDRDETLDILILGTHGSLTDTIMLASVNSSKETVSLFSIPRDLAVDGRRINEYYYRYGIDPMRDKIEELTGLYPEKYVVVDLAAFEDIVDILGGVDVYVETALYDTMYPGPNYTYETFSLGVGEHHLDGYAALKYARSRKSTTDFDRAKRQQQIVEAVRDKVEELDLLGNAEELIRIYNVMASSVDTDVDLISLISYMTQYNDYTIEQGNVLSTSNYLYSVTGVTGAYLLVPTDSTYQEIRAFVAEVVME